MSYGERTPLSTREGTSCALGIDIGSSNVKVSLIVIDSTGAVRELVVRSSPTPDDAAELVASTMTLIRNVLSATRVTPAVIGIASMAETGVALGGDGEALTPLIRWNGVRDSFDADSLAGRYGAEALFSATGVRPGPKVPLTMWAGLRRTRPDLWRAMARWSGIADLITLALTGELVTDHTLAGRTMAYRLPPHGSDLEREFDPDLLAVVGLRPEQLPRIALPGEIAGTVAAHAAEKTGLVAGVPVIVAGHDHAAGAWASGVRRPAEVADSIGTTEALLHILAGSADRSAVSASGMSLARTVTGEQEVLVAGSASAGSLISWWLAELKAPDPAGLLVAADALGPQPTGLLILPYLRGRQTPEPDPAARLRILDRAGRLLQIGSHEPAELTRALLEGLALQLRWMDAEQRRLAGEQRSSSPITVLGASGIAGWIGVKASVMPSALSSVTVAEPVASGAALLAAVRIGLAADTVALPRRAVPAEPGGSLYDAVYADFVAAATNTGLFAVPNGTTVPSQGEK